MSIQEFVLNSTDTKRRAKGLSHLTAGIFAGSICGCAIGAMLAQRIGL
ncbi:MAG: hypothetical protein HC887_10155 [Desulfobacteraceae bacterium]|nr:hypothetical protein [Desulfobacteraceae bacterium]